ncbi:hypothetical protein AAE02nite_08660 [Adhaeribacter aerolatus]|uniref:N-acetyltransferase domain-containing protein n=1 Tax=Adhaeribacter aerolatus TaxID=670289 RepID=A0A512AU11_9BACT|nr:GNAT family N-acetyltransferase [Adhaeribacter aerolatus]GEO03202.1 hypothetical protein AAE02nite_08660 [Adhaeribacter aerolatus]
MNQPEVNKLAWDSSFFGYPVGELNYTGREPELLKALKNAQSAGYKLIYLKSETKISIFDAPNHPFKIGVLDNKITFRKDLATNTADDFPAESTVRYTKPEASPELIRLALESGKYSRFARDPYFKHQEYEKLYTTWINKSVTGEMAAEVWVSTTSAGAITGMITLGKDNSGAFIGLLAVLPAFQRQGYGRKLLQMACHRASTLGCGAIRVGTQGINEPANSLYQSAGLSLHHQLFIYHLWL